EVVGKPLQAWRARIVGDAPERFAEGSLCGLEPPQADVEGDEPSIEPNVPRLQLDGAVIRGLCLVAAYARALEIEGFIVPGVRVVLEALTAFPVDAGGRAVIPAYHAQPAAAIPVKLGPWQLQGLPLGDGGLASLSEVVDLLEPVHDGALPNARRSWRTV